MVLNLHVVNGSVPGEQVGVRAKRSRSFARRRICATEGCATLLSIYNPKSHCATHLL